MNGPGHSAPSTCTAQAITKLILGRGEWHPDIAGEAMLLSAQLGAVSDSELDKILTAISGKRDPNSARGPKQIQIMYSEYS